MRPTSHHKRRLRERGDEGSSSGRDGGKEYHSTHFGDSPSDGGERRLYLESEEWEMISI